MNDRNYGQMAAAQARDLGYSLRRHFVDDFHHRHVRNIASGLPVLDLGGNRINKRGLFDIDALDLEVVYANLSSAKLPHVQADAGFLPFPNASFAAVICSELLEHVPDPVKVVNEMHRVLASEGLVLICVPFLNRIHGDPEDYGRYTDHYWRRTLGRAGFKEVMIEKQGLYWSVLVDMIRDLAYSRTSRGLLGRPWLRNLVALVVGAAKTTALRWDQAADPNGHGSLVHSFTTGFGIRAIKQ
jgi:SAM-dependent methyltransferase